MSVQPPQPPSEGGRLGVISRLVDSVRSLTLINALVIVILLLATGPMYLAWKIINDEHLLALVLSSYAEHPMPGTDCAMRVASLAGAKPTYFISHNFGFSGNDRWSVVVGTPIEPNMEDAKNYCRVLVEIVEYANDPDDAPNPTFPYSKRKVFSVSHDEVR